MSANHTSLGSALLVSIIAMSGVAIAAGDGLASYSGTGTIYVIEDGRVVLEYDASQDPHGLSIDNASGHYLISNGTTSTLVAPGATTPSGTKTKVKLDGAGCHVVGEFNGTLCVDNQGNDQWSIAVYDSSNTLIFEYLLGQTGTASGLGGCEVTCSGGRCSCSAPGICWCFCGLFGEPHCIHIRIVIGTSL